MQRIRLGLFKIFENNGRFENHLVAHLQHRHLAQRRNLQEPVRLVVEIDVDALERNTLLGERDHRALNEGAKFVADELEFIGHWSSPELRA